LGQIDFACGEKGIDWQIWFAAMSTYAEYPWTLYFVWKLLHWILNGMQTMSSVNQGAALSRAPSLYRRLKPPLLEGFPITLLDSELFSFVPKGTRSNY
jgi:hypothetical protein